MAEQKKIKNISLSISEGTFSAIFSKIKGNKKNSDISNIRQLLSNEKARLLHTTKIKQPDSVYELAKLLDRDFKAVRQDIKILENFGLIELISSHKKGRDRLKPVVDADTIIITVNI
jgi:predicted transcriptional regulator